MWSYKVISIFFLRLLDRLYIAPELLRNTSLKGTKQGDLYSFAIVCSEVITRRPAWSESESREEIEGQSGSSFAQSLH